MYTPYQVSCITIRPACIKQGANGPGPAALHNPSRKFQKQVPQLWKIMNFDRQNALLNGASIEAII